MSEDRTPAADDHSSNVSETSVPPDVPDSEVTKPAETGDGPASEESPVVAVEGGGGDAAAAPAESAEADAEVTPETDVSAEASRERGPAETVSVDAGPNSEAAEVTAETGVAQDSETEELAADADASGETSDVDAAGVAVGEAETAEAEPVPAQAEAALSDDAETEGAPDPAVTATGDEAEVAPDPALTATGDEAEVAPDPAAAATDEAEVALDLAEAAIEDEAFDDELTGVSFAHAPTGADGRPVNGELVDGERYDGFIDLDEEPVEEDEEELVPAGFDRRTDRVWWALTPISVLVLGPLLASSVAFFVALVAKGYPAICRSAAADNRCDGVVLRMLAGHVVAFLVGAVLIWALPWWRGLRSYRVALAVIVVLVLIAAPLRLLGSVDYQTVMGR